MRGYAEYLLILTQKLKETQFSQMVLVAQHPGGRKRKITFFCPLHFE
jgi:hypothetical protein